jgi:outer membrane biosynthesis protein TonB
MTPSKLLKTMAAMALSAALSLATVVVSSAPALAATCRNAGGGNGSISVGSQVSGNQVTICASKAFQKQLAKSIKPKPVVNKPKPVVRKVQVPNTKHVLNQPTRVSKPVPAKKPAVKKPVAKKPIVIKKKVTGKKANSAVFSPAAPRASVSPSTSLTPGQTANFSVGLGVRFGTATLFGNLVTVRFTPVQYFWTLGDGTNTSPAVATVGGVGNAQHAYRQGSYTVVAQVEYRVDYKVKGGTWLRDPDTIWLSSNPLNLKVSQAGGNGAGGTTVLVTP